ncbi:UNVERIFIED_CONTAM: hypothetical protein HDU68_007993 [Siphonaria sp. JEL0065]|nr:hypothetical protein HDU68_007993 [Siphonaria sp. JEL0065]
MQADHVELLNLHAPLNGPLLPLSPPQVDAMRPTVSLLQELEGLRLGRSTGDSRLLIRRKARVREQTDVISFIYRAADNLAGRANHEKSTDECIDFLLNVALNGQVNGSDVICQRNKSEREEAYKELSAGNGANSDNAVVCYFKLNTDEEAKEFGIQRFHEHRSYWVQKFENQSKESRESYKNSKSMMAKRSGKYKVLDDIRDYSLSEMTEVCRLFDNCCLVSGIGVEYAALSVDRYTRESHYEKNTISILLTRINDAKESDPLFFSDENLNSYMANNNIDHPLTVIVTRLREPLTRLIEFQKKKKRLETSIIVIED